MREYVPKEWRPDKNRYLEMRSFCRQYEKYKQELNDIRFEYRATMNGSGGVSSGVGNPVASKVDRMERLKHKIDFIEQTVMFVVNDAPELYEPMLAHITRDVPIDHLNITCHRNTFKKYRRYFYYLIDKNL